MNSQSKVWCLYKRNRGRFGHTEAQRKGHVKTETEIGVMLPLAKECQEPPEAERSKRHSSPRAVGRSVTPLTP